MNKKAVIPVIVWIVLGIVGLSVISQVQTQDDDFKGEITQTFTSLGQQAKCDIYPCDSGDFSSSKLLTCCSSGSKYPRSDNCLINVFYEGYKGTKAASECGTPSTGVANGCVEYIVDDRRERVSNLGSNSIYEIYNCPKGSLEGGKTNNLEDCDCDYGSTNSRCDSSNTCGIDKPVCLQISGDDICVDTGRYFKECPNGLDGSSKTCECDYDFYDSWKHQRCPSSKPNCKSVKGNDYCYIESSPEPPKTCKQMVNPEDCMDAEGCVVGFYGCMELAKATCEDIQGDPVSARYPSGGCLKKAGCIPSGDGNCIHVNEEGIKHISYTFGRFEPKIPMTLTILNKVSSPTVKTTTVNLDDYPLGYEMVKLDVKLKVIKCNSFPVKFKFYKDDKLLWDEYYQVEPSFCNYVNTVSIAVGHTGRREICPKGQQYIDGKCMSLIKAQRGLVEIEEPGNYKIVVGVLGESKTIDFRVTGSKSPATISSVCIDTDSLDPHEKGVVTYRGRNYEDSCRRDQVKEYYCLGDKKKYRYLDCIAPGLCFKGKCVYGEELLKSRACVDSDSGLDPFTLGMVSYKDKYFYEDYCRKSSSRTFEKKGDRVREYYCSKDRKRSKYIYCGAGIKCVNGECVK